MIPLIELQQNVNLVIENSSYKGLVPLIELQQNVNSIVLVLSFIPSETFNRTIVECKFWVFHFDSYCV